MARANPLTDPPPAEVPLSQAPLVRVIFQLRYPVVAAIEQREFVAGFQAAVQGEYPVLREELTNRVVMQPAGTATLLPSKAWRFSDVEGHCRLSLTPDFLALEMIAYRSRSDFLARVERGVRALHQHVAPKLVDRLGLRYVDRIVGPAVAEMANLVRPEVGGIVGTPAGAYALHSLTESLFEWEGTKLLARWGRMPQGTTIDPTIEPAAEPSWVLDLDVFSDKSAEFSPERILEHAASFADRAYSFFRWAVTDKFLQRYGGKP